MKNIRVYPLCGKTVLVLALSMASNTALSGSYDRINQAFGKTAAASFSAERKVVLPKDDTNHQKNALQNLAALASQNSFPLRMTKSGEMTASWANMPEVAAKPSPVTKDYKVGKCTFTVQSSAFAMRTYREENPGDFVIAQDSVMANYTFSILDDEALIASLSTTVVAEVQQNSHAACRKLFTDRRVPIGKASMTNSELLAIQEGHSTMKATRAKDGNDTLLFVTWDKALGKLLVVDEFDMPPTLETPIYRLASPPDDKIYYLAIEPKWKIQKT